MQIKPWEQSDPAGNKVTLVITWACFPSCNWIFLWCIIKKRKLCTASNIKTSKPCKKKTFFHNKQRCNLINERCKIDQTPRLKVCVCFPRRGENARRRWPRVQTFTSQINQQCTQMQMTFSCRWIMDAPFNIPAILSSFPAALLSSVGWWIWMQYVKPTRPNGIRFCARQTADINYGALAEWWPPPPRRTCSKCWCLKSNHLQFY
jgi:hypothetical protein